MLRCHHLHPPLLLLASRSECDPNALARPTRLTPARVMRPSRGVRRPSTLAEAGSDLCRACLTRLRSAFRLPRPLDAFLRLQPRRPCLVPATPLGFRLQRFPPPGSRSPSPVRSPSCCFPDGARSRVPCLNWARSPRPAGRSSKGSRIREIRSAPARCYPRPTSRSSPGLSLLEVLAHQPRLRASTVPPLMGFQSTVDGEPSMAVCALQGLKEPRAHTTLSSRTDLLEVCVLVGLPAEAVRPFRTPFAALVSEIGRAHV